jgi:small-conductance mechanosensitive channel
MVDFTFINEILTGKLAKLVAAIAILLLGVLFGRFLSKLTLKILKEVKLNTILKEELGIRLPLEEFFSRLIEYVVYFVAIIIALNQLGLTATVLYIVLISILVLIVVLMILAFKDFVPNLTAGFYISQKKNIKKGDVISINTVEGKILDINLIETRIKVKEGDEILVPNSMLLKSELRKKKN